MAQICKIPKSPKEASYICGLIDDVLAVELFRALSDPTRTKILCCLTKYGRPCSVSEIATCCNVDLSAVSRHLANLAAVDVLESYKEGRTVFYTVKFKEVIGRFKNIVKAFESHKRIGKRS